MRIFVPIFLMLAAIGLFVMYTNPTYQSIKDLQAQYSQYNNALTQSSQMRQMRDQLLTRRNTFSSDDVNRLERLLPDNVDNIRLIIDINDIAARYHLQVTNVSIVSNSSAAAASATGGVGAGSAALGTVELSFQVSATYTQFMAFLGDLQRSLRLIDVEGIKFSSGSSSTGLVGVDNYTVQIKTYWLR